MADFDVDVLLEAVGENTRGRFRQLNDQKQERQREERRQWQITMAQQWNNYTLCDKFNHSSSVPLLICLLWVMVFGFIGCSESSKTDDIHIHQFYVMIPLFLSIFILMVVRSISKWVLPTIIFWSLYAIGSLFYICTHPSNDCATFPVTLIYTIVLFLFNAFVFPYEMNMTL